MIKKKIIFSLIFGFIFCLFNQCENGNKTSSCFPDSRIDYIIRLDLPEYQVLNGVGGWMYISGPLAGTSGLIIVRSDLYNFKVYDRNSPYLCPSEGTVLEVKDNLYIYCPADGAKWILSSGSPLEVATKSPHQYNVQFVGNNTVYIRN